MKQDFSAIYQRQAWGKDKGSGTGSSPHYCQKYLEFLRPLAQGKRVLDLGCGDWQLYAGFNWGRSTYVGVDIVELVILENKHAHPLVNFECADFSQPAVLRRLIREHAPDLVLVKDVLQHWSTPEVVSWLSNVMTMQFGVLIAVNNWKHFRSPEKNGTPRNIDNQYRWAPIDMREYGFEGVLYYPNGKYKQVARLEQQDAPAALATLRERYCL